MMTMQPKRGNGVCGEETRKIVDLFLSLSHFSEKSDQLLPLFLFQVLASLISRVLVAGDPQKTVTFLFLFQCTKHVSLMENHNSLFYEDDDLSRGAESVECNTYRTCATSSEQHMIDEH